MVSIDSKYIVKYKIDDSTETYFCSGIEEICNNNLVQIKRQNDKYLIIPLLDVKKECLMKYFYVLDINFNIIEARPIDEKYSKMKKWSIRSTDNYEMYALFESVLGDDGDMFWAKNMKMVSLDYQTLEMKEIEYPYPNGFNLEMMTERVKLCQMKVYKRYCPIPIVENEWTTLEEFLGFWI